MSAHSPAPWIASTHYQILSQDKICIAEVCGDVHVEADHRLIAAAPELADACKKALSLIQDIWPIDYGNREVLATLQAMELALVKAGSL